MHRCLQLAKLGERDVAPNPMVGAVLVHDNRIIGEGYHKKYGEAHAESNCIHSVQQNDIHLIQHSTLYVSLEPCAHLGKTPPCADLIIQQKILKVVIGCSDPFTDVNGKGIDKLKNAGVQVVDDILKQECEELNKKFFCFHTKSRPYIILKWAQTSDLKIAYLPTGNIDENAITQKRLHISNEHTNRLVHDWRGREMAILIGTNTALLDDPLLTTRLAPGGNPVRLVIDLNLKLYPELKVFDSKSRTIVFNHFKHEEGEIFYFKLKRESTVITQILQALHSLNIQSLIVEGGAKLLQSFIDEGFWDEARIITNEQLAIGNGLQAPLLKNQILVSSETCFSDRISYYSRN